MNASLRTRGRPVMRRPGGGGGERGMALVAVLWIIVLMSLQLSLFGSAVRDGAQLGQTEAAIARGEAHAMAGVEYAVARLMDRNPSGRWTGDGTERTLDFAGATLAIAVSDEAARVDMNAAPPELWEALIKRLTGSGKEAAEGAAAIMAWRADPASGGRAQAQAAAPPRQFLDPTELASVPKLDPDLAARLIPWLTVYSKETGVHPELAGTDLLAALPGVDVRAFEAAVQQRDRGDPTAKDRIAAALASARPWLTAKPGRAYRVNVVVQGQTVASFGQAEAIVALNVDSGAPYRSLKWQYVQTGKRSGR
jgi:general secretion pathway protein K